MGVWSRAGALRCALCPRTRATQRWLQTAFPRGGGPAQGETIISRFSSVYLHRSVAFQLVLGFASGLPLALTGGTLQAWATVDGVSLQHIGFLTLVGSAYTLKFLWAPLIDRYAPPWLGRRRGWMASMQVLLGLVIIVMGMLSPASELLPLAMLAVLVGVLSATQDIAFDAYSTDVLAHEERGAGAALKVLGYRLAMLVSGGLALILADRVLGWGHTYVLMGLLMLLCVVATWAAPEPAVPVAAPRALRDAISAPFQEFFSRQGAFTLLALIVLYKLGDAFAGALSTTFLIRAAGFTAAQVGEVNKVLGLAATIIGSLAGGAIMVRIGLYRSLMWFGLLQAVSNLGYWMIAVTPRHVWTMAVGVGLENLCGGLGTAAFVALLMAMCHRRFSATQFALLSALSAVGRTYLAGPLTPPLVGHLGWPSFFLFTVVVGLPGLALLWWKRRVIESLDHDAGASSAAAPAA